MGKKYVLIIIGIVLLGAAGAGWWLMQADPLPSAPVPSRSPAPLPKRAPKADIAVSGVAAVPVLPVAASGVAPDKTRKGAEVAGGSPDKAAEKKAAIKPEKETIKENISSKEDTSKEGVAAREALPGEVVPLKETPSKLADVTAVAVKKHSRIHEDARHCLDFPDNMAIIKCAEKYR